MASKYRLPYLMRAEYHPNPVARRLFTIADAKQTNVVLDADLKDAQGLLRCADALGPYIAVLKVNSSLIRDFNDETVQALKTISAKHKFLLYDAFEVDDSVSDLEVLFDRIEWAHIVAVTAPGCDVTLASLIDCISDPDDLSICGKRAIIMAPDLSSRKAAALGFFTHGCVEDARQNPDTIMGFTAPQGIFTAGRERYQDGISYASEDDDFVHFTSPGPAFVTNTIPATHRQLSFPHAHAAVRAGADFVVVGRDIIASKDPVLAVRLCRADAWAAYEERLPPKMVNVWVKPWDIRPKRPSFGEMEAGDLCHY